MEEIQICVICDRILGKTNLSKHHLIPKSRGGKNGKTILIHNICHQKIHSLFSERELRDNFSTVQNLKNNEEIIKFTKWVSKKAPSFYQSNKKIKRK